MSDHQTDSAAIRKEVEDALGYYGADEFFNTTTGRSEYLPDRDELIDRLVRITTSRLSNPPEQISVIPPGPSPENDARAPMSPAFPQLSGTRFVCLLFGHVWASEWWAQEQFGKPTVCLRCRVFPPGEGDAHE